MGHMPDAREEEADTMDLGAVDGMISECISRFPSQLGTHRQGFLFAITVSTRYYPVHHYYIQQIYDACDDQRRIISSFITTFWDTSQSTRCLSCLFKVCKSC